MRLKTGTEAQYPVACWSKQPFVRRSRVGINSKVRNVHFHAKSLGTIENNHCASFVRHGSNFFHRQCGTSSGGYVADRDNLQSSIWASVVSSFHGNQHRQYSCCVHSLPDLRIRGHVCFEVSDNLGYRARIWQGKVHDIQSNRPTLVVVHPPCNPTCVLLVGSQNVVTGLQ